MIPLPVKDSIIRVNKKPSIAILPFQFSAEVVNPHTQGKKLVSFSIKSYKKSLDLHKR